MSKSTVYNVWEDADHSWLEAPIQDVVVAGVNPDDISGFSYVSNDTVFLEEDCDAPLFLNAHQTKYGNPAKLNFRPNGGFVRRLTPIHELRAGGTE